MESQKSINLFLKNHLGIWSWFVFEK